MQNAPISLSCKIIPEANKPAGFFFQPVQILFLEAPAIIECGLVFVESGLAFVESGLVFVAPFCILFIYEGHHRHIIKHFIVHSVYYFFMKGHL